MEWTGSRERFMPQPDASIPQKRWLFFSLVQHCSFVAFLFTVMPRDVLQQLLSVSECTCSRHGGSRCPCFATRDMFQRQVETSSIWYWFHEPLVVCACFVTTPLVSRPVVAVNRALA